MAKAHGILAIVAAVVAAFSATILFGGALFLPSAFAVGAGIFVAVTGRTDIPTMATAVAAALFGILGIASVASGFGAFSTAAGSLAVAGCMLVVGSALAAHWKDIDMIPAYVAAGALGIGVILAFVFMNSVGVQGKVPAYIIAALSLSGVFPGIIALRKP